MGRMGLTSFSAEPHANEKSRPATRALKLTSGPGGSLVQAMSTVRKPAACTLAWLAVVALVLFGAPSQNQGSARRSEQQTSLGKLAAGLSSAELLQASSQRTAPSHKLLKPWDLFTGPERPQVPVPAQLAGGHCGLTDTAVAPLSRTTLVGIVELRV